MEIGKLKKRSEVRLTESPIEDVLLSAFRSYGLFDCVPQYEIGPYRADFAFPEKKIVVECDGREFHSGEEQAERDKVRDEYMRRLGWVVIRFWGSEIHREPERCAKEVLSMWYPKDKRLQSKYGRLMKVEKSQTDNETEIECFCDNCRKEKGDLEDQEEYD